MILTLIPYAEGVISTYRHGRGCEPPASAGCLCFQTCCRDVFDSSSGLVFNVELSVKYRGGVQTRIWATVALVDGRSGYQASVRRHMTPISWCGDALVYTVQ